MNKEEEQELKKEVPYSGIFFCRHVYCWYCTHRNRDQEYSSASSPIRTSHPQASSRKHGLTARHDRRVSGPLRWRVHPPAASPAFGQSIGQALWRSRRLDATEYCAGSACQFSPDAGTSAPCRQRHCQRAGRQSAPHAGELAPAAHRVG